MRYQKLLWLAFAACKSSTDKIGGERPKRTVFFDKAGMDTTVKPGDNFFEYANGTWVKKTPIPPSETGWGSFNILYNENQKHLHDILIDLTKADNGKGSKEQKVADLYLSGMDTIAIDKRGYDPIKPNLKEIAAVTDNKHLMQYLANGYKDGSGFLMGFVVGPDDKNSRKNLAQFNQTGLTLFNREYYFKTDTASVKIRAEFLKYVAKLFTLTGTDTATAAKNAHVVLKLETEIAASHSTPVELRDPVKNYHKFVTADFQKKVPDIDLKDLFSRMGFNTDTILVGQPKYFTTLDSIVKAEPVANMKTEIAFRTISRAAGDLSKPFRDANFDFFNKVLYGQKQKKERWKDMVDNVDYGLGELLGQFYVEKYFTPDAKSRMLKLVNNLQQVYAERIKRLDWMGAATKQKALDKLNAFTKKIGYPNKWKSYDDVEINKNTFYENQVAVRKHNYNERLKKINKKVDKTEWGMTPPTVNAYYNPSFNEIVFPAGILQFPFFDKDADDAINYGAIGAVIGHEMTHGFDDQGSQYDKDGNLKEWWTKEDEARFKAKTAAIAAQYDKYIVLGDQHVNGKLTLGENIADNGGVAIAYEAFKNTEQGKSTTKIQGFTPDQRFFLSFAQVWREKLSDPYARMLISVDPHSPAKYRTNGPLSNTDAWYKAFNVQPGDKLYRPENERVKIW